MPKAFDECVGKGGKVRTRKLKGGRYQHICILNGKVYAGEIKKRKGNQGSKAINALEKVYKEG